MGLTHLSLSLALCAACSESCSACADGFECRSCRAPLLLQGGRCVASCAERHFQDRLLCAGNARKTGLQRPAGQTGTEKLRPSCWVHSLLRDLLLTQVLVFTQNKVNRGTESRSVKLITGWGNIHQNSSVGQFCWFKTLCSGTLWFFTTLLFPFRILFWKRDRGFGGVEEPRQGVHTGFTKDVMLVRIEAPELCLAMWSRRFALGSIRRNCSCDAGAFGRGDLEVTRKALGGLGD